MPALTRRTLLLALLGGSAALTACSLPGTAPGPTRPQPAPPTSTPPPTATNTPQRVALPTAVARTTPTPAATPTIDPVLRSRRLLYVGTHAGQRGLVGANGDGSGAGLIAAGSFSAPIWSPNGERFVAIGTAPGEERLAPHAWIFRDGLALLHAFRLEGLDDRVSWAPDSRRLALLAQRSDVTRTRAQATATYLVSGERLTEIAIAQQTWARGWTANGRLVLSATSGALDEDPTERPRSLWTTSVAGDDRRQVASGDYDYVGLDQLRAIAFALGTYRPYRTRSGATVRKPTDLIAIDLRDGQAVWRRTAAEIAQAGLSGAAATRPYWLVSATASPRGDAVAVWLQPEPRGGEAAEEPSAALAVVAGDGTVSWAELVPDTTALFPPLWSPWGERLAFGVGPENTRLRLRLSANEARAIATTNVEDARWSPDGEWIAYSQDQRLLVSAAANPNLTHVIAEDGHAPRWQSTN